MKWEYNQSFSVYLSDTPIGYFHISVSELDINVWFNNRRMASFDSIDEVKKFCIDYFASKV